MPAKLVTKSVYSLHYELMYVTKNREKKTSNIPCAVKTFRCSNVGILKVVIGVLSSCHCIPPIPREKTVKHDSGSAFVLLFCRTKAHTCTFSFTFHKQVQIALQDHPRTEGTLCWAKLFQLLDAALLFACSNFKPTARGVSFCWPGMVWNLRWERDRGFGCRLRKQGWGAKPSKAAGPKGPATPPSTLFSAPSGPPIPLSPQFSWHGGWVRLVKST